MPNRILFLVSAVLASLALPLLPNLAYAADDCLASPDKATPAGGHWRFHLERGTGRKCWYLAGAAAKADAVKADTTAADADDRDTDTTASAPPKPAAKIAPSIERAAAASPDRPHTAKPTPTPSAPATLGPATNARAEFIDTPPVASDAPPAGAPDATPQQGSVPTRWPNPGNAQPATDGNSPAATNAAAAQSARPAAAEVPPSSDRPAQTALVGQATPPAQQADTTEGPDYLLYALIIFTTGFAIVVALAGLRFLLDWWRDWREETRWRRSEQTYAGYRERSMTAIDEIPMGLVPDGDASMPRTGAQRPSRVEPPPVRIEDEIDQIEQLLAMTRHATPETQPSMWDPRAPRDAAE